jgi:hypothetical protein
MVKRFTAESTESPEMKLSSKSEKLVYRKEELEDRFRLMIFGISCLSAISAVSAVNKIFIPE